MAAARKSCFGGIFCLLSRRHTSTNSIKGIRPTCTCQTRPAKIPEMKKALIFLFKIEKHKYNSQTDQIMTSCVGTAQRSITAIGVDTAYMKEPTTPADFPKSFVNTK